MESSSCPCGSGNPYSDCCQPYHGGRAQAPTAEALMRSRYAAYATSQTDYLVRTTAPEKRGKHLAQSIESSNRTIQWIQLEIHQTCNGGPQDKKGTVEFTATFSENGNIQSIRERSRFIKRANQWFYLDGIFF